jgi:excisionase family DNA binding protein
MAYLGVSRATVYRLAGRPGGITCKKFGKSLRFQPSDVREYARSQTLDGTNGTRAEQLVAAARNDNK